MELRTVTTTFSPPTPGPRAIWPPPSSVVAQQAGGEWTAWALATIASIWTAVLLISLLSPDMIHGSEQQRLPIAALGTWLWGCGASIAAFVGMARLHDVGRRSSLILVFGATVAIWTAATLVSVLGPTTVTGSDPTTIPMAALIAPVVAMVATFVAVMVVTVAYRCGAARKRPVAVAG